MASVVRDYYINGDRREYFQINGKREGSIKSYKSNGDLINSIQHFNGIQQGISLNYIGNNILSIGYYINDKLEGPNTMFDEKNNIISITHMINNKANFMNRMYNENNILYYKSFLYDNKVEGKNMSYHSNGSIWFINENVNNKLNGEVKQYDINGKLIGHEICENGRSVKRLL